MTSIGTDALKKAISENREAVVYTVDATSVVQESMERIGLFPPATVHLGQGMMAAVLLQALTDQEDKESVSLQWMCNGPFGHLYVDAKNYGECRGTIQNPPHVLDYDTKLGPGILQVLRKRQGTTTGVVNAVGDVPLDVLHYLESSEQKSCGLSVSVRVDWENEAKTKFRVHHALGYLIHILPQPTEQKKNDALLRWDRQMRTLGPISRWLLRKNETTLDMLTLITGEEKPNVIMNQRVIFSCNCTEERAAKALALLAEQEKKEGALVSQKEAEIRCEYCGQVYLIPSK